jgi:hypothetical protein
MTPALDHMISELEAMLGEVMPTRDLCTLWLDLVAFRKEVDLVVRAVEEEATESLIGEIGEVTGKRSMYDTPAGPVRLEREPQRRRAHGRAIVEVVALDVVTADGEMVKAVPVLTLRAILPHAATEEASSYAWRWRELRSLLGADEYALLVDETPIEDRRIRIAAGEAWT